jgi:predicted Zn finger-like uncharacterized protein
MIITCPACSTRYDVPEGAIGAEGRTVRCAQCRHSWFQPGPEAASAPEADIGALSPDAYAPIAAEVEAAAQNAGVGESAIPTPPPTLAAAPAIPTPPTLATAPRPPVAAAEPLAEGSYSEDDEIAARPRRRGGGRWIVLLGLFILLAAAIGGALAWYGTPDWLPIHHTALASTRNGLALDFPPSLIERKTLGDGTEFFGARGTVTNTTGKSRAVPPIEIVLRDSDKRVVYRWEVVPPKHQLAPGESMTITEAVTDVPKSAILPEIGWKAV